MAVVVPVVVTLVLLVALGALAYYLYRKWDLQRRQQQLLAWAGRQIPYRAMDEAEAGQAHGDFSHPPPKTEAQELRKFESSDHGFHVMAPADWEYHEGGPDDAAILQCICPVRALTASPTVNCVLIAILMGMDVSFVCTASTLAGRRHIVQASECGA